MNILIVVLQNVHFLCVAKIFLLLPVFEWLLVSSHDCNWGRWNLGIWTRLIWTPQNTSWSLGMRQSCNSVNVFTKSHTRLLNVYTNMAAMNKNQLVLVTITALWWVGLIASSSLLLSLAAFNEVHSSSYRLILQWVAKCYVILLLLTAIGYSSFLALNFFIFVHTNV